MLKRNYNNMVKELRTYRTRQGKEPFTDWLDSLKDRVEEQILPIV